LITISFETAELHDCCVSLQRAEQLYGTVDAQALVTFLADAAALENVAELLDILGSTVDILPDDSISVTIGAACRARLIPVGKLFDRDSHGKIVWTSVTRLKLQQISRSL
jgi:hypothetical protein